MCAALFCVAASAQNVLPVPPLSGRVIDQTNTLSPAQQQALSAKLAAIEAQRGTQIVVLMVPSTQPEDFASFSQRIAEAWKLGRRDVGDGLVIVVAKNDRRVNIEVAKTLEGAIPDVLAGRVISDQIKPAFRADDYAGGLNAAVDRLDKAIAGEALPAPAASAGRGDGAPRAAHHGSGFDWQDLALFLFVGVPIVGSFLSRIFGRKLGAVATGAAVGGIGWVLTTSALLAGGAGLIALFLVGVMGSGLGASGRGRSGLGPMIWGGGFGGFGGGGGGGFGGGGGGDGGGGGGGGFGSGGGGDFGGGGASGSW